MHLGQEILYQVMGLLRIPRTVRQVGRILEIIPDEESRWRWCDAEACGCLGCVNRSEADSIGKYRLRRFEHRYWQRAQMAHLRKMHAFLLQLPGVKRSEKQDTS